MGNIHSRDNATHATLLLDLSQVLAACIEKYTGWDRPVAASPLKCKASEDEDDVTPVPKRVTHDRIPVIRPGGKVLAACIEKYTGWDRLVAASPLKHKASEDEDDVTPAAKRVARDRIPIIRPGGKREAQDKAMEPPAKKHKLSLSRSIPVLPRLLHRHETMLTIPLGALSVQRLGKRKSGSDAGDTSKSKCPRVECYLWCLPNELLLLIVEELAVDSLCLPSQVCTKLRDIAARLYFALLDFHTPDADGWLAVEDAQSEALPLWRHSNTFSVPQVMWFASLRCTNDCQFVLLWIFFESLKGLQGVRCMHLCLYGGPTEDSPVFQSLLQSIQASGCKELFCSGSRRVNAKPCMNGSSSYSRSCLRVLEINSPLLFTSYSSSFTLSALRNAPLHHLALTNTKLTPDNWTTLLQSLSLLQLSILAVDDTCPIFIVLSISYGSTHCTVSGFLTVLSLVLGLDLPFQCLAIRLNHLNDTQRLLPILLSCTEHFTDLQELQVTIPNHADALSAYVEGDDLCTCSEKQVVLSVSPPAPHPDTIMHCAPWMKAFLRVNKLWLHTIVFLLHMYIPSCTKDFLSGSVPTLSQSDLNRLHDSFVNLVGQHIHFLLTMLGWFSETTIGTRTSVHTQHGVTMADDPASCISQSESNDIQGWKGTRNSVDGWFERVNCQIWGIGDRGGNERGGHRG
ncbi:hypothetical protein BU15DRAFT_66408 [Melanogaster broomeanus]|nr:hypothetical protein BU15DRAFT_66408 [Melanogaster broomeanus]